MNPHKGQWRKEHTNQCPIHPLQLLCVRNVQTVVFPLCDSRHVENTIGTNINGAHPTHPMCHRASCNLLFESSCGVMGGGFLAWRWGRDTNANRKEKEKCRNKSRLRRVRFKDTSASSVVLNKEKKRVWFSRFWFSLRRKQNKRKSSLENTFNAINTMTVEPECKF